jgi:hypothetical protein
MRTQQLAKTGAGRPGCTAVGKATHSLTHARMQQLHAFLDGSVGSVAWRWKGHTTRTLISFPDYDTLVHNCRHFFVSSCFDHPVCSQFVLECLVSLDNALISGDISIFRTL